MFEKAKHKSTLTQALSDCFEPLRSDLGNVHPSMRQSRFILGSLLGLVRAYAIANELNEKTFDLLVDAAFEEIFRSESISVQTRAQQYLNDADSVFMEAYHQAKSHVDEPLKLDWLSDYAQQYFKKARTLGHPL